MLILMRRQNTTLLLLTSVLILSMIVSGCTTGISVIDSWTNPTNTTTTTSPIPSPVKVVGDSRKNPAPIGTTVEFTHDCRQPAGYEWLNIGADLDGKYRARITILETMRGQKAMDKVASSYYNSTIALDEGMELLIARVRFELLDMPDNDTPFKLGSISFDVVTSDGRTISKYFYQNAQPDLTTMLYEGAKTDGWITLACAKNDSNPLLVFENKNGKGGIWFKTTR
jgi:hypothetical protein